MISIIIRTKNEERWIRPCLEGILRQEVDDNIEIVLVDNDSSDKTVERALSICPDLTLVELKEFIPGHALNEGIRASKGDYIVCLSAHCPAVDQYWLANLKRNFDQDNIAGVYGRQVPTRFTNAIDKRDLLLTFGLDKRVQIKDTFFHNANSMLTRSVWERFPFDEQISNIEDRLWGQEVITAGMKIIYEPEAAVFHHHGIHQDNRPDRANNVVRILEAHVPALHPDRFGSPFNANDHEIVAIIPLRETSNNYSFEEKMLSRTISAAKQSSYISRIMVATDSQKIADMAIAMGAEVPFLRPKELSDQNVRVDEVLQQFLYSLEAEGYYPDVVVPLEVTYPLRPDGLIDGVIDRLLHDGFDTVMAGLPEYRACWRKSGNSFIEVTDISQPRDNREPLHVSLPGLACAVWPQAIREGSRFAKKIGIFETDDPLAGIEIRTFEEMQAIEKKWQL